MAGPGQHASWEAGHLTRPSGIPCSTLGYSKSTSQVTLPAAMITKLEPPAALKKVSFNEKIAWKITLDPELMKDWAEDSATSYLAATINYYVHYAFLEGSNMKDTAKMFHIKLTALHHYINGRKYTGGSKAKKTAQHYIKHKISQKLSPSLPYNSSQRCTAFGIE